MSPVFCCKSVVRPSVFYCKSGVRPQVFCCMIVVRPQVFCCKSVVRPPTLHHPKVFTFSDQPRKRLIWAVAEIGPTQSIDTL